MKGSEIAKAIVSWVNENGIHPDDFDIIFVHELLAMLEEDE